MTIWQKRIAALKEKGITQAKIAKEAGCTDGAISLLADGSRKDPSFRIGNRIVELCALVRCDIESIDEA
jgi:transcriptional regulator with XRE-family HTH domain